ncbi:MAG: ribosome-binding ATPase YchF [Phycisphaerae bacterium]|nr:MAG: redox-regulated ATPase YchF [Planctomycetia bacterium]GJQ25073.1 MAG: ribosome-binding ATPase YchF [Phycisphaerae bacterium]
MKFALIGPMQSGKSTLFSAITGQPYDTGHAPAERLASVPVPDKRLDYLAEVYKPKKYTPAHLEFLDIPGFSLADAGGVAEFRKAMQSVRKCDGIVAVVRGYESPNVASYRGRVDPRADVDELHAELIFADLEQVTNRIEKLEKSVQKPTKTRDAELRELAMMKRVREALESESPVSSAIHNDEERGIAASFGFLTLKPVIVVVNVGEAEVGNPPPFEHPHARATIALAAEIEMEVSQLEPADRAAFLADLGIAEPAQARLIRACYDAVGLISFLTCGEDEVRAWTITKGTTAVDAAGKIHSDIQRGFIRAETVSYADFEAHKDMKGVKAANKVRLEPKHYVVLDGDIINFRFNV